MYFACCLAVIGLIPTERGAGTGTGTAPPAPVSAPPAPHTEAISTSFPTSEKENKTENDTETENEKKTETVKTVKLLKTVRHRQMTYCVWGQGDKNPKAFTDFTPGPFQSARKQGSIFLRKLILPSYEIKSAKKFHGNNYRHEIENDRSVDIEIEIKKEKLGLLRDWLALVYGVTDSACGADGGNSDDKNKDDDNNINSDNNDNNDNDNNSSSNSNINNNNNRDCDTMTGKEKHTFDWNYGLQRMQHFARERHHAVSERIRQQEIEQMKRFENRYNNDDNNYNNNNNICKYK